MDVLVLDGVVIVEGKGQFWGLNLGRSIVTNGDFATRLFPNYFGQYLFTRRMPFLPPSQQRQSTEGNQCTESTSGFHH